jgi:hypothetical protein
VEALLAQADGSAALLGAHVFTFHSATPDTLDAAPGIWARVSRAGAQTLAWALLGGLDDARYNSPLLTGEVQLGTPLGAATWLKMRLVVRGGRAVASVAVGLGSSPTLLFSANADALGLPAAGFFGLGTGSFTPLEASFRNLNVSVAATTCDSVPAEGAAVEVEMCQSGSPGEMFEMWLPRSTAAADFSYTTLPSYDAPDLDCGGKLAGDASVWGAVCADNLTAALNGTAPPGACACTAFNSNGYPKAAISDLEVYAYGTVALNVMQPPLGQLRLSANTSLCISASGPDGNNLVLAACSDDADAGLIDPRQLFGFSRSIVDSAAVCGPMMLSANQKGPSMVPSGSPCVDVWDLSFDVDHVVRQGSWNSGSNQIFSFPLSFKSPALIRAPQMDVCLGACAQL